jgi:hypothetical protein
MYQRNELFKLISRLTIQNRIFKYFKFYPKKYFGDLKSNYFVSMFQRSKRIFISNLSINDSQYEDRDLYINESAS